MVKNISILKGTIGVFILFLLIGFLFSGKGYDDHFSVLMSISAFFFGIFVAFSVANSHARLNKVNEALKNDGAILLSLYKMSGVFGKEHQEKIQKLLDNYLVKQVDFYLQDFRYTADEFVKIFEYFNDIEPKTDKQKLVYQNVLSLLTTSSINRTQVEVAVRKGLLRFEWISILALLGLIIFIIFYFNNGSLASVVISALLSTAAVILVFVLRDLDNLRWKEETSIWEPLHNLFKSLELLPYYPDDILTSGRVRLEKGESVRVVKYANPYPIMTDKNVEIKTI